VASGQCPANGGHLSWAQGVASSLKHIVAEQAVDLRALKAVMAKKW
jgi:hypothetical protein